VQIPIGGDRHDTGDMWEHEVRDGYWILNLKNAAATVHAIALQITALLKAKAKSLHSSVLLTVAIGVCDLGPNTWLSFVHTMGLFPLASVFSSMPMLISNSTPRREMI